MTGRPRIPAVLSIAGSDSGGGAGIQADLKAFARCGVHGMTAITALTAQSTIGVLAIHAVPPAMIVDQVRAVAEDIGVDAVKVGMLGDTAAIAAVVEALTHVGDAPLVLDPVMVAESGAVLLERPAIAALIEQMLPLATVATPNLVEARELTGLGEGASAEELARAVHSLGPAAVVVTGGHGESGEDVFYDGSGEPRAIPGERHPGTSSHGSGCTHSAALAAQLALGLDPFTAAQRARQIAAEAVRDGLDEIGAGPGPVDVLGLRRRDPAG
ncbi:MAG: hydroxymethylpyrimidine/phosphomethylpyrimidine kinase [Solirubrobacterales bacterium]|nr:hydroxymethylpyrimidine/phosphomethylpyrimidine kinase [Solirubrobacterales bacterium]